MIDVNLSSEYMKEYKTFINVGIDCGQMGVAYYRVSQTEINDATHLVELRSLVDIECEVLEMFINQLIGSYNVCYKVSVQRQKESLKGVLFETKEYGSVRGA